MRRVMTGWGMLAIVLTAACGSGDESATSTVSLSGTVRDYFTDAALPATQLGVDFLTSTAVSDGTGAYTFSSLPANAPVQVVASHANYRGTRNFQISLGSSNVAADVFVVANADATRQYTALSITETAGTACVIVELVDGAGQPREGIPLVGITLLDAVFSPVGTGPFIFGVAGDVDPALTTTVAFGGRARVAFVNVPQGSFTVRVVDGASTLTAPLLTTSGGVTLVER